jgi:hypothetical protein
MALAAITNCTAAASGRNLGVGLTLVAFIVLVFGLTIAKVSGGGRCRPSTTPIARRSTRPPESLRPGRGE